MPRKRQVRGNREARLCFFANNKISQQILFQNEELSQNAYASRIPLTLPSPARGEAKKTKAKTLKKTKKSRSVSSPLAGLQRDE
jgi:hypothetical protein